MHRVFSLLVVALTTLLASAQITHAQSIWDHALTASFNYVFMQRGNSNDTPLIQNAGGGDLLNANQFGFDFNSGLDASLVARLTDACALEARYLGVDAWTEVADLTLDPTDRWLTNPPSTYGNTRFENIRYTSRLQSAEASLRTPCLECADLLFGFRFVNLNEILGDRSENMFGNVSTAAFQTNNRLYGFQLGADTYVWSGDHGQFNVVTKAGIYCNEAQSQANSAQIDFPPAVVSGSDSHTAFVGELNLLYTYQLTDRCSFRVGYQFLWLEGVAIAADQVAQTANFTASPLTTTTDATGGLFAHGGVVGFLSTF